MANRHNFIRHFQRSQEAHDERSTQAITTNRGNHGEHRGRVVLAKPLPNRKHDHHAAHADEQPENHIEFELFATKNGEQREQRHDRGRAIDDAGEDARHVLLRVGKKCERQGVHECAAASH